MFMIVNNHIMDKHDHIIVKIRHKLVEINHNLVKTNNNFFKINSNVLNIIHVTLKSYHIMVRITKSMANVNDTMYIYFSSFLDLLLSYNLFFIFVFLICYVPFLLAILSYIFQTATTFISIHFVYSLVLLRA